MTELFLRRNPDDSRPMDYRQSKFQRELYRLIVLEKKVNIINLAEEIGKKTDTVYAYCEGELRLHLDEARRIIRIVSRENVDAAMELLTLFVPAGFRVVRESNVNGAATVDIRDQQLDLSRLVGRIQELVKDALADGRVDRAEHRTISRKVATLKTIATELDERLRGGVL